MSLRLKGRKVRMSRVFDEKGNLIPCTVIALEKNIVVQVKTEAKDGYQAYQLGAEMVTPAKKRNVHKPLVGHFAKAKVEPRKFLSESKVKETYEVGQEFGVEYFAETVFVDVTAHSKGKGYQGVMKRHNFAGGPASHGSGFHRHGGSTGMRTTPGRCLPGVKMAGHMGHEQVTQENLKIVKIDAEKGLILVKGAIPGHSNAIVTIRKSVKKQGKN